MKKNAVFGIWPVIVGLTAIVLHSAACHGQKTNEISSDDLNMAIDQDSIVTIAYQNGKPFAQGAYIAYTQGNKENGRVEFQINKQDKADGLIKFYTVGNILFKAISVKNSILQYDNHYDQHHGRLQDSLYFAMAEIPVFEDNIPTWKNLRTQQRIRYFNSALNTHEVLHNQNIVLKTTYDQSRKNMEICNSIYKKMFYENGTVSSVKSVDWEERTLSYEQFNQQGLKVIEIVQSDRNVGRTPYIETKDLRAANAEDFYRKTNFHDNGQPQEIVHYNDGIATTHYYNESGNETSKTTEAYDVLPMLDTF